MIAQTRRWLRWASIVGVCSLVAACPNDGTDDDGGGGPSDAAEFDAAEDAAGNGDGSLPNEEGAGDGGGPVADGSADASVDGAADGALDSSMDALVDASDDAALDASDGAALDADGDAFVDASEAGVVDAAGDALVDGGHDAGPDAGPEYRCYMGGRAQQFPGIVALTAGDATPYHFYGDRLLASMSSGWSLWSAAGELLQVSANMPVSNRRLMEGRQDAFLEQTFSPSAIEMRALDDGRLLWSESLSEAGGLATDGSYGWVRSGGSIEVQLRARSAAAVAWLDVVIPAFQTIIAVPDALYVVRSTVNDTTLTRYPRAGGAPTTIGPVAGAFVGTFEDGSQFLTKGAGNLVRVFDLAGTRKASLTSELKEAGGRGQIFWLTNDAGTTISFYDVATTPTLRGTTPSGTIKALPDGLAVTHDNKDSLIVPGGIVFPNTRQWERVRFTGNTVDIAPHATPNGPLVIGIAASAERVAYRVNEGDGTRHYMTVDGVPARLGCGLIYAKAARNNRLYLAASLHGLYVYDAPPAAPTAYLPLPGILDVRVARTSGHIAVKTLNDIYVYDKDLILVHKEEVGFPPAIDISMDGTHLSWTYEEVTAFPPGTPHARVRRLTDKVLVYSHDRPEGSGSGITQRPVVLSPSNRRMADNVSPGLTRLYEDGALVGTFVGVATEWLDENRVAAFVGTSPGGNSGRVLSHEGISQGVFECVGFVEGFSNNQALLYGPWGMSSQWIDPNIVYARTRNENVCSGCRCAAQDGALTVVASAVASPPFAISGADGFYDGSAAAWAIHWRAAGAQLSGATIIRKRAY